MSGGREEGQEDTESPVPVLGGLPVLFSIPWNRTLSTGGWVWRMEFPMESVSQGTQVGSGLSLSDSGRIEEGSLSSRPHESGGQT